MNCGAWDVALDLQRIESITASTVAAVTRIVPPAPSINSSRLRTVAAGHQHASRSNS